MLRTNIVALKPTNSQHNRLIELATDCAQLWNEINYRRRQSYFQGCLNWEWRDLYDKYKGNISAATAQQIERKNNEAWRSFFALLKVSKKGRLPPHIKKISPPGYWKDKKIGKYKLQILIRCDSYRFEGDRILLPKKLCIKWHGNPRWIPWIRQGQLIIIFDEDSKTWYVRQPVEVSPPHRPLSSKRAYVDLGVKNLLTIAMDGERQTYAFSGRSALADWWYWSHQINCLKSLAKKTNNRHSTKRVRQLFRRQQRRFRQYVNSSVRKAIHFLWRNGVSILIAGDLTGIRENCIRGRKANSMIHNFWSHRYLIQRVRYVAEEYGMELQLVDERGTSSSCIRCGSLNIARRGRLFRCHTCGLEAHRDAVGAVNISAVCGGRINRVMAHPLEVSC